MKRFQVTTLFFLLALFSLNCKKNSGPEQDPLKPVSKPQETTFKPREFPEINAGLVTPGASYEADKLYKFLKENYGKKIISGTMTLASFDETNYLKKEVGKEPAIVGLDFMHCFRDYTWYNDEEPIRDAKTYWDRNGIPVFVWHWRDPSKATESFYATTNNQLTFDVSKINDPASEEYKAMLRDIDQVSGLLKKLQDQNVPVIWRPLHEAAGTWFWWGSKGAQPCKKLYQVMYDRMVNHHGLKNLIWVWTREPKDNDWYPGDEYVDIVGRDIYHQGNTNASQIVEFNALNTLYGSKKIIALTECESIPNPDYLMRDKASWSWFMPWYGLSRAEPANATLIAFWKKLVASHYVITLDEMPSLKRP